jgi:tRNA (Thr-GGU) A37 N-methylase
VRKPRLGGIKVVRNDTPDRPNPIGLHRVKVLEVAAATRLRVFPLEAIDGTPVVDIKPALPGMIDA